jgi:hypothetical protein
MRRWVFALGVVPLSGCAGQRAVSKPEPALVVEYSVQQDHAPRHFLLTIPAHGSARVSAFSPLTANPNGRAGFFGAPLGRERRAQIERVVDGGGLLRRSDEANLSDNVGGALRLGRGDQHAEISLGAKDQPALELRQILDGIVGTASERPVAALSLEVHARADGPAVKIYTRFVESGIQPIEIAMTRDDSPSESLAIRGVLDRGGRLVDEQRIGPSDSQRLAAAGKLPKGWKRIEPNSSFELPPLAIRVPADTGGLYAGVEATVSVRTRGEKPIDIEIRSLLVSVEPDEG